MEITEQLLLLKSPNSCQLNHIPEVAKHIKQNI